MTTILKKRRPKYGNKKIEIDGIRFDSQREATRFFTLRMQEKQGEIRGLKRQIRYPLHAPNMAVVGHYVGDFEYVDALSGATITEDVKSPATEKLALFRWKSRHFEAQYGRRIRVTR